jgi:hypothetical protein
VTPPVRALPDTPPNRMLDSVAELAVTEVVHTNTEHDMGTWRITVDGLGCHHNGKREIDADLAAADFVKELQAQGHTLSAARFEARGANVDGQYDADAVDKSSPMNINYFDTHTAPEPAA